MNKAQIRRAATAARNDTATKDFFGALLENALTVEIGILVQFPEECFQSALEALELTQQSNPRYWNIEVCQHTEIPFAVALVNYPLDEIDETETAV